MKKITLLALSIVFSTFMGYSQNLLVNGDFETGSPGDAVPSWGGFKNRIANDDIVADQVGQIENGDGSLFQEFNVTPGETYNVTFDYRWVGSAGSANSNLTVRIKEVGNLSNNLSLIGANNSDGTGYELDSTLDTWLNASFSFTVPAGINAVRLLCFKPNGNKPLNLNNATASLNLSVDRYEEFNFQAYPNPVRNELNISANTTIDNIQIFDLLGNRVKNIDVNNNFSVISLGDLSTGIYILKTSIQGSTNTMKIVKQ
jgi:hypothetical protein